MEYGWGILGQTALLLHGNVDVNAVRGRPGKVLTTLLAHPNRRVPIDTVVEWVWTEQESRPLDPVGTLHQAGARLRQMFQAKGVDAGVTIGKAGCRLEVDERLIDHQRFRAMMARAREFKDRGLHDRAHVEALAAVRLRRDEPLADLRTDPAEEWRVRWSRNEWVPANAFVVAQQLLLGQTELAVARLEELDAAHPLELSLAKLRIRALIAAGRTLEATEFFRRLRREFQECGDMHAADELLRFYNEAAAPGATSFPAIPKARPATAEPFAEELPAPVVLRHLPPDVDDVVGRGGVLAELDAFTTDSAGLPRAGVVMLTGAPGMGKTTVAVRWAHRAAGRYPDGVVMLDVRGDRQTAGSTAAAVVETLLELLEVRVDEIVSPVTRAARLTRMLRGRRLLVVLDNVARTDQVEALLPVLAGCTVVLVTRQRLSTLRTTRTSPVVTLTPLPDSAAKAVLERRIGLRARQDAPEVDGLVRMCQGNALALTLVAERAVARTGMRLLTLTNALRDADMLLDLGNDGDWPGRSLRSAFTVSFQALAQAEQRAFMLLGVHPGAELGLDAVVAVDGRPRPAVRRSLDVLVAAHLVEQPADLERFRLHDLLHLFAASLISQEPEFAGARRRMLEFYLLSAFEAHRLLFPAKERPPVPELSGGVAPASFATAAAARQWILRERSTLLATVRLAREAKLNAVAYTLPSLTADVLDRYGHFQDIIAGLKVAVSAASDAGDVTAEASSLCDLGQVLLLMGEDRRAEPYLHAALQLVDAHSIGIGRVSVMLNLARRHLHAGRVEQAVQLSRATVELAETVGDQERLAAALHRMADALVELGAHQLEALGLYRRALALRERIGDNEGRALTHVATADLLIRCGEFTEADVHCGLASALVNDGQHLPTAMKLNTVLARLRHAQGEDRSALKHAHRAVDLANRSMHATGRARALDTLAQILRDRGELDDARMLWERAARLFRDRERIGSAERIETILRELGEVRIPQARVEDEDTVSLPWPPGSRSDLYGR